MFANSWKRWLAAGAVVFGAIAQAAPVSVRVDGAGPFSAGELMTVRFIDADPSALCGLDLCRADLRVSFDTALVGAPTWGTSVLGVDHPVAAMVFPGAVTSQSGTMAFIDFTLFLLFDVDGDGDITPDLPPPAGETELFSMSFIVQAGTGGTSTISVTPFAERPGAPPIYEFEETTSAAFEVTPNVVPEPGSLALMAVGLGLGGWATRRRSGARHRA